MKVWYILFFSAFTFCHAQRTITGTIKDKETQLPVPFVSVGMVGTYSGTITNQDGSFSIPLPDLKITDSIGVFAIGYETKYLQKQDIDNFKPNEVIYLIPVIYELQPTKIKPRKNKFLGTEKYTKNNCSAFAGIEENWKGKQVAILANNKPDVTVFLESFGFYIVKNEYEDSLQFRLMLYEINEKGMPGKTFLKSPIVFKTNVKQGEVRFDLRLYNINYTGNFFISLECLEEKMESEKFCFAGSIKVPSYFKTNPFAKWGKTKGGGVDLNLKVGYLSDK